MLSIKGAMETGAIVRLCGSYSNSRLVFSDELCTLKMCKCMERMINSRMCALSVD